jgi:hypothetical protein
MVLSDRQAADMRASQAVSEAHNTLARLLAANRTGSAMAFHTGLRDGVRTLRARLIEIYAELEVATQPDARDELVDAITKRVNAFIQSSVASRRGPDAVSAARQAHDLIADNIGVRGGFDLAVYDNEKKRRAGIKVEKEGPRPEQIRLLFLSANPDPNSPLDVEKEQNRIVRVRNGSRYQDQVSIESLPDLDIGSFAKSLRQHSPMIVHFSGHGETDGSLLMRDHDGVAHEMHPKGVAKLLALQKDTLRLVVLNACHSRELATLVVAEIDCVVGMRDEVADDAAILFSQTFYGALFDGRTIGYSFAESVAVVAARYPGEENIPSLEAKVGVDTDTLRLLL